MTDSEIIINLRRKIAILEEENKNLCDRINLNRLEAFSMGRQLVEAKESYEKLQNAYNIMHKAMREEVDRIEADWNANPHANYLEEITMINRIQNKVLDYWKEATNG